MRTLNGCNACKPFHRYNAAPPGCTTVKVRIETTDWIPSATYTPCNKTKPETWYLPWRAGESGYVETKDVASNTDFVIGPHLVSCKSANCLTIKIPENYDFLNIACFGDITEARCREGVDFQKSKDHTPSPKSEKPVNKAKK